MACRGLAARVDVEVNTVSQYGDHLNQSSTPGSETWLPGTGPGQGINHGEELGFNEDGPTGR